MITDPQELYRFLATPGIEVTNFLFAGDEVLWVVWGFVEEEENMPVLRHTKELIGAYLTTGTSQNLHVPRRIERDVSVLRYRFSNIYTEMWATSSCELRRKAVTYDEPSRA